MRASFDAAADAYAAPDERAWYRARLPVGGSLTLAAMCGYGRVLVPLAQDGISIHGVDASAAMLAECEARLKSHGLAPTLFRQEATRLNLPFRYGCAFIDGGALQSLGDGAAAHDALARIHAHLIEPGLLLVDFVVPAESMQRIAAPLVEVRSVALADGSRIALRSETSMYADAGFARIERRYAHRAGNVLLGEEHESASVMWWSREDAAALIAQAGYVDVEVEPSARPPQDGDAFAVRARAPR